MGKGDFSRGIDQQEVRDGATPKQVLDFPVIIVTIQLICRGYACLRISQRSGSRFAGTLDGDLFPNSVVFQNA